MSKPLVIEFLEDGIVTYMLVNYEALNELVYTTNQELFNKLGLEYWQAIDGEGTLRGKKLNDVVNSLNFMEWGIRKNYFVLYPDELVQDS